MNILIINHNIMGEGTYLRCYQIAKYLVSQNHRVTLLTTSKKSRFKSIYIKEDGIDIIQFPDLFSKKLRNGICPWNTVKRIYYLRNKRFDIIHAFDTRPVVIFPGLFYRKKFKVPLILDWADWWGRGGTTKQRSGNLYALTIGQIETFFEEYFRKYADFSTAICTALKNRLIQIGYDEAKILLLPQGTDFIKLKHLDKDHCRKILNVDLFLPIIGHLGTLFKKDAVLLFDSMERTRKKIKNIILFLIGRHKIKLANYDFNNDFLIETGEIEAEKIPIYLSACDILVLPMENNVANNGRWPSKINDYLASCRPIISTPISDIKTIFQEFKIGVTADDNPEDFSNAIITLLADKTLQTHFGEKGKEYAEQELNWSILVEKLCDFYDNAQSVKT